MSLLKPYLVIHRLDDGHTHVRYDFERKSYVAYLVESAVLPSESLSYLSRKCLRIESAKRRLQIKRNAYSTLKVLNKIGITMKKVEKPEEKVFVYGNVGENLLDLMLDESHVFGVLTPQSDDLNEILTYFPDFPYDSDYFEGPGISQDDIFFNVDPTEIVRKIATSETGAILISIPNEELENGNAFFNKGMLRYAYVNGYMQPAKQNSQGTIYVGDILNKEAIQYEIQERLEELKLAREKKPTNN